MSTVDIIFDKNKDGIDRGLYIEVSEEPIDFKVGGYNRVEDDNAGAISTFLGTTRNNFKGKNVEKLEYEAYTPMAVKEIAKICSHLFTTYNILHIAVLHRIGTVPIGEASILIAISSAHRHDSLTAVQYAIDTIKATVPIWKKEYYTDGTMSVWKDNCESCHYTTTKSTLNNDGHDHQHSGHNKH
ncbi:molybdenum cofactor synthesis protein 2 large subunit [Heterostelium album PN500]|uniref:Molybdopterin synthase catalytic subunit n=1 Tax=Heterostelium pallidum (strain ATCC 26659 / Pp 5 / PN500) TaxID=670386 RepID=D3BU88_HETP5|nr:molybdenum cofactor synthesis protein 2 large subunit [Heterostelium album PN500]EFA75022.1 molybdenum cofactor synthesis protein 2 large subunit [Heterostelium album PN500]|eukprot:XP_020427156.1 molybdenum cofactor synthesis protein 2 large subunit [Heterostelium album PN500]